MPIAAELSTKTEFFQVCKQLSFGRFQVQNIRIWWYTIYQSDVKDAQKPAKFASTTDNELLNFHLHYVKLGEYSRIASKYTQWVLPMLMVCVIWRLHIDISLHNNVSFYVQKMLNRQNTQKIRWREYTRYVPVNMYFKMFRNGNSLSKQNHYELKFNELT